MPRFKVGPWSRGRVLALLPILSFVAGVCEYGPARRPVPGSALLTVHAVFSLAIVVVWFLGDARERGYKASWILKLAMPVLTVVALPYYLLRSRGFVAGVKALILAAFVVAGTMAAYRVGTWLA
jgi:hypothetical protein